MCMPSPNSSARPKRLSRTSNRGEQFTPPLGNDELTFFDAVSTNESATELMDEVLAEIARQLVSMLRRDAKTD
ncbi:hypothetical protein HMPREF3155_08790 [Corynebacterium sp. HMSC06D04]|nr:hypothetical protein HMPREF2888_07385 [Corynebacterium sp. HMSC077D03]OFT50360.1 hypothetical protein HMPREF3155_08790 [Corynebacterium sp. HMSC06D04]OHO66681.1 hypothetical protein HMPREF2692_08090 [Corynebacterium sp. HMSC036D03]